MVADISEAHSDTKMVLTLPTNKLTRPSAPTAAGNKLVMSGVDRPTYQLFTMGRVRLGCIPSRLSWEWTGAALAIAAAITASISAEVGGRVEEGSLPSS